MKKIVSLFLILAMLLTLCACDTDERLGRYYCMNVDYGDGSGQPDGEWIDLTSTKSGKINNGLELSFDWSCEGDRFTMTTKLFVDTYTGTLKDGILVLDWGGTEMTFVKEGVAYTPPSKPETNGSDDTDPWSSLWNTDPTTETEPATEETTEPFTEPATETPTEPATEPQPTVPQQQLTPIQTWWNGNYYGYYALFEDGEDTTSLWWDCCADIDLDVEGEGLLRIWDESFNDAEDGVASLWVKVVEADETNGYGFSVNGWFLNSAVGQDEYFLDTTNEDFPDGIHITGWYTEDDAEYSLNIYLRKWGMGWEDVADNYIGLPEYYDSWYKPAIDQGLPMPSTVLGECGDGLEAQPVSSGPVVSNFIPVESEVEVKLPLSVLAEAHKAMDDNWLEMYSLDYADVITNYLNGVEGRIGYVNDEVNFFCMYWTASDAEEYSMLEVDFQLNEEGVWMYAGKGGSNAVINE